VQLAANASHRRPILVVVAFGHHQRRLGNVLMSAMSNSMSLGMLNGDGFVLLVGVVIGRSHVAVGDKSRRVDPNRRVGAPFMRLIWPAGKR